MSAFSRMDDAFTKNPKEILDFFKVDINKGLTQEQVEDSTKIHGKNGMYFYLNFTLYNIAPTVVCLERIYML